MKFDRFFNANLIFCIIVSVYFLSYLYFSVILSAPEQQTSKLPKKFELTSSIGARGLSNLTGAKSEDYQETP